MTGQNVVAFLEDNAVRTVEEFVAALPPLYKRHFVAIHSSSSPLKDFVFPTQPRIVSWGADARFILAWGTNPASPGYEQVEFLQPVPEERRWIAGVVDFSGATPEISRPVSCSQCHGSLNRPLWGAAGIHEGTERERIQIGPAENELAVRAMMAASTDPRVAVLDRSRYRDGGSYGGIPFAGGFSQDPNWDFATQLVLRHAEGLFGLLSERSNYGPIFEASVCAGSGWDLIISQFSPADFNLSLLSGSLQPIQGALSNPHGRYGGGSAFVATTVGFLMLHDAWQNDEKIASLYRRSSNTEVLGGVSIGLRDRLLRYDPGAADAEEELVAAFEEFFSLRGQANIDARVLRDKETRYNASFIHSHFLHFRWAVCSVLRGHEQEPGGGGPWLPPPAPDPPQPPEAAFGVDAGCGQGLCRARAGEEVAFVDKSSGTVESRTWDFGDGGTSRRSAPRHAWNSPGFFTVTLTVTDGDRPSTLSRAFLVESSEPVGSCEFDAERLCLRDSRYAVSVDWWTSNGNVRAAKVVHEGTNDSGLFHFVEPGDNWEILIKVLDGCSVNDHLWVYGGSATDLGYTIRVMDTVSSETKEYRNEPGSLAPAITHQTAFRAGCEDAD